LSKVVVTGGAGFIGSHLVDALVHRGHDIIVIDNLATGKVENINPVARFLAKDVTVASAELDDVFTGVDYVFHLAAQINLRKSIEVPVFDCLSNVLGTVNVLEASAKAWVKKIIYFSTGGALYAPVYEAIPWKETDRIMPLSPYGVSKWCGERYVELYSQTRGLDHVILRPANVYGPRQDPRGEAGVVSIFMERIRDTGKVDIFGDGHQRRDFIHVNDVVGAAILAMESNIRGPYNVSTGKLHTVMRLACMLFEKFGKELKISRKPAIKGEMYASCLSNEKLRAAGWTEPMSLEDGLSKL
jgi:UDP-glucose 4-epimerase